MLIDMKKIVFVILLALSSQISFAWGAMGHKAVVAIAERHLTQASRDTLAKWFSYSIVEDASWMDKHRKDEQYAYTGNYHTMFMNHDFVYDPSLRMVQGGDCVTGLSFVEYNLSNRQALHLTDSAKVVTVRLMIHIVGDMHCLSHAYVIPERNQWIGTFRGQEYRYHALLDHITDFMYEGMSIPEIAEHLDTFSEVQMRAWARGSFVEWAQECCMRDSIALEVNPYGCKVFAPETVVKLTPAVEEALKVAGYRLADLLNRCLDPDYR